MNPETLLNMAVIAIDHRPVACAKRYHLTFINGVIACVSTTQPVPQSQIVGTFSDDELKGGLTGKQWDKLTTKLARFWIEENSK